MNTSTVAILINDFADAVKLVPIVQSLSQKQYTNTLVVSTTSCRETKDLLNEFGIKIDYQINSCRDEGKSKPVKCCEYVTLEKIFGSARPSFLIIHGENHYSFQAVLCAFYNKIPVGHVHSTNITLEDFQKNQTHPRLINLIADIHFTSDVKISDWILKNKTSTGSLCQTGNTSLITMKLAAETNSNFPFETLFEKIEKTIFLSIEKRNTIGPKMLQIFMAMREIAISNPKTGIAFPLINNPNMQTPAKDLLADLPNIFLLEPLDYFTRAKILKKSSLVLSDSEQLLNETEIFGLPKLDLSQNYRKTALLDEITPILNSTKGWVPISEASLIDLNSAETIADCIFNYLYFRQPVMLHEENFISDAA